MRIFRLTLTMICGLLVPYVALAQVTEAQTSSRLTAITTAPARATKSAGLLPTALDEARVAAIQAGRAAGKGGNLTDRREYAADVLHAIDPALAKSTLGAGVGVRPALSRVVQQLQAIAETDGTAVIQRTVPAALASARQLLSQCDQIVSVAQRLLNATDATDAEAAATQLTELTRTLLSAREVVGQRQDPRASGGLQGLQLQMSRVVLGRDAAIQATSKGASR